MTHHLTDLAEELLGWLLKVRWGRIAANGIAAFFTVLAGVSITGGLEETALKGALAGALIQAGLAAAQEFKTQNGGDAPPATKKGHIAAPNGKMAFLLF